MVDVAPAEVLITPSGAAVILFVYSVAAFGLAYVVGHAAISQPFRDWCSARFGRWSCGLHTAPEHNDTCKHADPFLLRLIECPACFGWWLGFFMGLAVADLNFVTTWWPLIRSGLIVAFYTAGMNFILAKLTRLID